MHRQNLLEYFAEREKRTNWFLTYDDGYRSWRFRSNEIAAAARALAARLRDHGLAAGDKVILWGENRPGWIIALWGCLLEGIIVVPVDYRSSADFLLRVAAITETKLVIAGEEVALPEAGLPAWSMHELEQPTAPKVASHGTVHELAEILFTSGATGEPKGVRITHRNLLANLEPVEGEILRYRSKAIVRVIAEPLFFPIRFLNLLPLSHLFGQTMGAFIPPMVDGEVVFLKGHNPAEIARQVKRRRISVIVCVPKMLELLRTHLELTFPEVREPVRPWPVALGVLGFLPAWWQYGRVHRALGWKFWAFVVGAAPLDPELEGFWRKLGYVVVQGYGLTETAPIVSLNHPFHASQGSVGKAIPGVEIKLAEDGEILVRGDNVSSGYYGGAPSIAEDGWFHTGDVGEMDADGSLRIRGRKKEMIVTPEGMNVFPEDVERALLEIEGVSDAAVIEQRGRPHAVLILDGVGAADVVARANEHLEEHQRIRSHSLWTHSDALPRTEGTQKLKRRAIREQVESGGASDAPAATDRVEALLARYAGRAVTDTTSIAELGLSSLERVQLLMELEEATGHGLDEVSFANARTVSDLKRPASAAAIAPEAPIEFPTWSRSWWARAFRRVSLPVWILPLARIFLWVRATGLENLRSIEGPVIFASNHQSYLDTAAILLALPARFRYRLAPAMRMEFFEAHFYGAARGHGWWKRLRNSFGYYLACLGLNAYPLPQREAGTREALRYAGELASAGYSTLIFPEGRHLEEGTIAEFQPGVGMLASRLEVPVIPVRVEGVAQVLQPSWKMARPGRVRVHFGPPVSASGHDYKAIARRVEEEVKKPLP